MDVAAAAVGIDLNKYLSLGLDMEDDTMSISDSFGDTAESDKQRASLQSYLDSVPYECESIEDMQAKLEDIVSKIVICAKSKNWLVLTTWDGILQW